MNNFNESNKGSLQQFNQFLSNTVETTTEKGIRNATKPPEMSIESDWLNLILVSELYLDQVKQVQ